MTLPPVVAMFARHKKHVNAIAPHCATLGMHLMPVQNVHEVLNRKFDGVILPGGPDISPIVYGMAEEEGCGPTDPARDYVELALLRRALAEGKPMFGICRGMQLLNVALGGTLYQHVDDHDRGNDSPPFNTHAIRSDNLWFTDHYFPVTDHEDGAWFVNSRHHQMIAKIACGFEVIALAVSDPAVGHASGIEAIHSHYHNAFGVQFHPEDMIAANPAWIGLFAWLSDRMRWG